MRSADQLPSNATGRLARVAGASALATLLAASSLAWATENKVPITATVTVSSSSAAVARALDADALTRWCPTLEDARGELTIRFARPVKINKVTVLVGNQDLRTLLAPFHPPIIRASLGEVVTEVDPAEDWRSPIELEAFREKRGQVFLLRLDPATRPASNPAERCVADLENRARRCDVGGRSPRRCCVEAARIRERSDGGVPCVRSDGPAAPCPVSAPAQGTRCRVRWCRVARRE